MKKGSYNCHFIGNVNNPKVVLIHGMGFYWEKCFTPIIEALELEYCLIIPELEGHHNKSEKTDIKIADCVNRLEQELTSNNIKHWVSIQTLYRDFPSVILPGFPIY